MCLSFVCFLLWSDSYDTPHRWDDLNLEFQQHTLNAASGLYFEEIGNVRVYYSDWTFVTYVNLTYFVAETEHMERTIETIQTLCDGIKAEFNLEIPNSYCDNTMPQLYVLLDEVKEYSIKWFLNHESGAMQQENLFGTRSPSEIMEQQYGHEQQQRRRRRRRRKRGFFGTLSKRLFFSMSEEEAEFYKDQINTLKKENVDHFLLMENQTTLFKESLKVLNSTVQSQTVQRSALQRQIIEIENLINNATASDMLSNKLIELMQHASVVMTTFWQRQQYFYNAITSKSSNFQLIPPQTFMNELQRVNELIKRQELELPLPLTNGNLAQFYQMATTEGRIIDNNLVIRISIPLVDAKKFMLYRTISVPYRNDTNDTYNFIKPRHEYIAIDNRNGKFLTLTNDELNACHRFDSKNLICKQTFPIVSVEANFNNSDCEINMIRNGEQSGSCDTQTVDFSEEIWVKMIQHPNTYLYTLPKPQHVVVVCPNTRTKIHLDGVGIISLAQRCRIKTERLEIVAYQSMESKIIRSFTQLPASNIIVSMEIERAKNVKSLTDPNLPTIDHDGTNKVTAIHNDLNGLNLKDRVLKASIFNSSDTSKDEPAINPVLLIIICIVVIVIIILIAAVCFKYCAVQGCNFIILIIIFALIIPGIFYLI